MPEPKLKVIIDSGAFSAWNSNKVIDLDQYCDYIKDNLDWIHAYVNLDVINPEEPEKAAQGGWDNFVYMRSKGLDPMPVFHAGEDISWLYKYLDAKCRYIGLSASTLEHKPNGGADQWYALIWPNLLGSDSKPIVKVHGFGEGRLSVHKRFPWHSIDSATWIYTAQHYRAFNIPGTNVRLGMRDADHLQKSKSIPDARSLEGLDRADFNEFLARAGLSSWFTETETETGITPRQAFMLRSYCTALYLMEEEKLVKMLPMDRYKSATGLILASKFSNVFGDISQEFNLHFVIGNSPAAMAVIAFADIRCALASFATITDLKDSQLMRKFVYAPQAQCLNGKLAALSNSYNILKTFINQDR